MARAPAKIFHALLLRPRVPLTIAFDAHPALFEGPLAQQERLVGGEIHAQDGLPRLVADLSSQAKPTQPNPGRTEPGRAGAASARAAEAREYMYRRHLFECFRDMY